MSQSFFVRFKDHTPHKLPSGKDSKPLTRVEVANGDYRRVFEARQQPFVVESQAEMQLLIDTGLFVGASPETKPAGEQDANSAAETEQLGDKARKGKAGTKPQQ